MLKARCCCLLLLMQTSVLLLLLITIKVNVLVVSASSSGSSSSSSSSSTSFRWYCDLSNEPIVELRWDPTQSVYAVWDGTTTETTTASSSYEENNNNHGTKRRRLLLLPGRHNHNDWIQATATSFLRGDYYDYDDDDEEEELDFVFREAALSAVSADGPSRNLVVNTATATTTTTRIEILTTDSINNKTNAIPSQSNTTTTTTTNSTRAPKVEVEVSGTKKILVRRCPCWNLNGFQNKEFFCPLERTHCGIGAGWSHNPYGNDGSRASFVYEDPGCLDVQRQQSFARNVWPVVTVWYLAMLMCLCLTRPGRHAMGYCISKVCPYWNVSATNRIIRQNPEHANRVVFRHMAEQSAVTNTNRFSYAGFEVTFQLTSIQQQQDQEEGLPSGANNNNNATRRRNGEEFLLRTKTFRYADNHNMMPNSTSSGNKEQEDDEEEDEGKNNLFTEDSTSSYQDNQQANALPTGDVEEEETFAEISSTSGLSAQNKGCHHNHNHNHNNKCDDDDDPNDQAASASAAGDVEEFVVSCTICHMEIEDGERVGDLPCGHTFHIECLKSWITRRNVCPLCLTENIATPRGRGREERRRRGGRGRRGATSNRFDAPSLSSSSSSTGQSTTTTTNPLPDLVISGE